MTYLVQLRSIGPSVIFDDDVIVIEAGIKSAREAEAIARKYRRTLRGEYIVQVDVSNFRF